MNCKKDAQCQHTHANRLSEYDFIELVKRMERGDQEARDLLILSHIPLVKYLANIYAQRSYNASYEDLYQEGCIGLVEAIDRYDYRKQTPLSSYATYYMVKRFQHYIRKQDLIVIPEHMYYRVQEYFREQYAFQREHGRLPTTKEMSKILNLPVSKVQQLSRCAFTLVRLDHPPTHDQKGSRIPGETLHSVIIPPDSPVRPVEEEVLRRLAELDFCDLDVKLTRREEEILRRYFGLTRSGKPETFPMIGKKMGLSGESVRLTYHAVIKRLRSAALERGYTLENYPLDK